MSRDPAPADREAAAGGTSLGDDRPIIEARGLSKRYGAIVALDGVDLEVGRGESIAVFGPNGAGKTTLTRILASTLRPTSGSLRIAGRDPRVDERETRRLIGFISHHTLLYDDLSARENLHFFAKLYGVRSPEAPAEALLESLGLADRADDPARTFSRGMQQRLALARALIHEPPIVYLDEPFTGLDPRAAATLQDTLSRLRRERRTLVVTTHDLARGLDLADRWLILLAGRLVAHGRAADVDRAGFEQLYFERLAAATSRSRTGVRA